MFNWGRRDTNSTANQPSHLEVVLNLWAKQWAQEHGSTVDWVEYAPADLERRLGSKHAFVQGKRHLSYKDVTPTDVITTEEPQVNKGTRILGGDNSSGGWSSQMSNSTHAEQTFNYSTTKTLTSQKQTTWTTGVTLNLGVTLSGGIPFLVEGKTTISTALSQSRASATTDIKTKTENFGQVIKVMPGKKTFAAVQIQEIEVKTNRICRVHLEGDVVICCKTDVNCPEISDQKKGLHNKWHRSIHQVFLDLERYSQAQPEIITPLLALFSHEGTNISFELKGETVETQIAEATVVVKEEDIAGWMPEQKQHGNAESRNEDKRPGVDIKASAKKGGVSEAEGHTIATVIYENGAPQLPGSYAPVPDKLPEGLTQPRDIIADSNGKGSIARAKGHTFAGAIYKPASKESEIDGLQVGALNFQGK